MTTTASPDPATLLSAADALSTIQRWKKEGLSPKEIDELHARSLELFGNSSRNITALSETGLSENIANIATLAKEVDQTFVEVQKILLVVVVLIWPIGIPLMAEWTGYTERWRACLRTSVVLAATISDALKRFDEIYLQKVETIVTEQDRLNAMAALRSFITELERNDQSAAMSRQFLDLKRDVLAFVSRFNLSAMETAVAPLLQQIDELNALIIAAHEAIAGVSAGFSLALPGVGASISNVVTSLEKQRQEKVEGLTNIHTAMKLLNGLVIPSASTQWDQAPVPDIGKLLESLSIFAEIWSSIRNQSVQFVGHLEGGLAASTTPRFKSEVKLARTQCQPLAAGLLDYKRQLESWI